MDALNYQFVLSASIERHVYAISGVERAFLLSVLRQYVAWANDNGLPLTDEQYDNAAWIQSEANRAIMSPIAGMIIASVAALDGFLICDGGSYNVADYPSLAEIIGYTGDTFSVPDLRDRFIIGASFSKPVNDTGGSETHTLSSSEMPVHSHTESTSIPFLGEVGAGVPITYAVSGSGITGTAGSGLPHNNMPPYYALMYLISTG